MNVDAVKWLADYEKIISIDSLKLNGNEFVLAYDINNPEMYERLWRSSGSLLVMDDADFFSRWQRKLEIDTLLKKEDVPTLVMCHSIKDAIARMNNGNPNDVVCLEIDGKDDEFCREFVNEWERNNMRKFELIVMNPPYAGKGDPLFMKIAKVLYDNCLEDNGIMVSINPTSVTDNTYDTVSAKLKKKYGHMNVNDFIYNPDFRTAFDAAIGTGICITIFSKSGKYNLWSDFVKERRFGQKNWDMRKSIVVEKVKDKLGDGKVVDGVVPTKSIASFIGFGKWTKDIKDIDENSSEEAKNLWDEYMDRFNSYGSKFNGKNVVVLAYNRGNVSAVGEHKWDWTTLQSDEYLKVQTHLPNMSQFNIPFETKTEAVNLIKWLNTDFIMYIVSHYKTQMTNNMILFKLLPQPPAIDGNYSDEVLMKHFNLTQEEMDWIHSEMKDFGWKVNLKKTESELMAYIDEINK